MRTGMHPWLHIPPPAPSLRAVTGQAATEEEIDEMIETGESETIFQKAILEQGRGYVSGGGAAAAAAPVFGFGTGPRLWSRAVVSVNGGFALGQTRGHGVSRWGQRARRAFAVCLLLQWVRRCWTPWRRSGSGGMR